MARKREREREAYLFAICNSKNTDFPLIGAQNTKYAFQSNKYHLVLMHSAMLQRISNTNKMLIRILRHIMIIKNRCSAASN